ncbi:MAG: hypothetical protein QMD06_03820 [Candidatus Altarchaeum sp.]|nr:hypothetical protein [Candidatus Altarchaeum sp.]
MIDQIKATIGDFDKTIIVVDGDSNPKKEEKKQKKDAFSKININ